MSEQTPYIVEVAEGWRIELDSRGIRMYSPDVVISARLLRLDKELALSVRFCNPVTYHVESEPESVEECVPLIEPTEAERLTEETMRVVELSNEWRVEVDGHEITCYTPRVIVWVYIHDTPVEMSFSLHTFDADTFEEKHTADFVQLVDKHFDWAKGNPAQ